MNPSVYSAYFGGVQADFKQAKSSAYGPRLRLSSPQFFTMRKCVSFIPFFDLVVAQTQPLLLQMHDVIKSEHPLKWTYKAWFLVTNCLTWCKFTAIQRFAGYRCKVSLFFGTIIRVRFLKILPCHVFWACFADSHDSGRHKWKNKPRRHGCRRRLWCETAVCLRWSKFSTKIVHIPFRVSAAMIFNMNFLVLNSPTNIIKTTFCRASCLHDWTWILVSSFPVAKHPLQEGASVHGNLNNLRCM